MSAQARACARPQRRLRLRRLEALVVKEVHQILRDPSSIAIGIVLPLILILLFGYGLSLDPRNVPIALVIDEPSPQATELAARFALSTYFRPERAASMPAAERLLIEQRVDGILRLPSDFARRLTQGNATVQLLVSGGDANRARIIQSYVEGALGIWSGHMQAQGQGVSAAGPVALETRIWFNEANDSRYFLVPGLIVLVMTLIGALLTAMVMAREYERGTLESLLVTPVRIDEILLGKTLPYFVLGLGGLVLCVLSARLLFQVPLRGSLLILLAASMLYVLVALGIGLLISTWVKSQLVASQLAMLVTFMPAFMLSGLLFDLRSMPPVVRGITYLLPARYYVALLQTLFLAGDVWAVIVPNTLVLLAMAGALAAASRAVMRKRLA